MNRYNSMQLNADIGCPLPYLGATMQKFNCNSLTHRCILFICLTCIACEQRYLHAQVFASWVLLEEVEVAASSADEDWMSALAALKRSSGGSLVEWKIVRRPAVLRVSRTCRSMYPERLRVAFHENDPSFTWNRSEKARVSCKRISCRLGHFKFSHDGRARKHPLTDHDLGNYRRQRRCSALSAFIIWFATICSSL